MVGNAFIIPKINAVVKKLIFMSNKKVSAYKIKQDNIILSKISIILDLDIVDNI